MNGFSVIQNYFEDEPESEYLRSYIKSIIGALFEREVDKIGQWEGEAEGEKHFFEELAFLSLFSPKPFPFI